MRFDIKWIATVSMLILLSICGFAQKPTVKASLDSTAILIGDQVTLHIEVELEKGLTAHIPDLPEKLTEFVEVVTRKSEFNDPSGAKQIISRDFIVTSFDSGFHAIDPIWITYQKGAIVDSVSTNSLLLAVYTLPKLDSLMNAMKGPVDIKAPYEAPLSFKEIAPWIMGILLGAALLFLIFYTIRRQQSDKPLFFIPEKPKEPAHITAMRELERIKIEQIWSQGETKRYYSELTDTLRRYIEDRFSIQAMEQTTEEILTAFNRHQNQLNDHLFNELSKVLSSADLVKFAKFEPLPDENDSAIKKAIQFVEETKQIEQVIIDAPKTEV